MRITRRSAALAIGITAAVALAACGSDDESSSTTAASATTAGGSAATAASATTPGATTAASTPGSAPSEQLGLIDGVYKGTSGFEIDPADCPADWNRTQGITDTDINLYVSLPTSGPLAGFGLIADGMRAYFNKINEEGGIEGRKIHLDSQDDGYAPDKTKTNVDEALGSGKYAALDAVLGTPNNLAVWDSTNDECMPQLFNATGAAQWGDVENHPWTTGLQLDYFTEAGLWAKWLQSEHPELTKVAEITFNSDFGQSYHKGFAFATKGTNIEVVDQETHEPTAPNLDNQFTTLAASGAEVLLIETSGSFCTQAMANVQKQTSWHPLVIMSLTCGSLNQFFKPLIDQGLTGEDTYLLRTGKDVNDAALQTDPAVVDYKTTLTAQGLDPNLTTYASGWYGAWYMVDVLKNAATYEGGLDRGNIILAARNIHATMPLTIDGLTTITDGMKDAYLTEGGQMVQYKVTDPKALGTFQSAGDVINLEGQLGTYQTVLDASAAATTTTTT
jgi:branched-chain amino acid transport system substrate-binding protein